MTKVEIIFMGSTTSALSAMINNYQLIKSHDREKSELLGEDLVPIALYQFSQLIGLFSTLEIFKTARNLKIPHFELTSFAMSIISPSLIAYQKHSLEKKVKADREIINTKYFQMNRFVHSHIGDMAQIINVISLIALYAIGQTVYAYFGLSFLGLGYIVQKQLLPSKVCDVIETAMQWINYGSLFFLSSSKLIKFIALLNITSALSDKIDIILNKALLIPSAAPKKIPFSQVQQLEDYKPRVNAWHFNKKNELPPEPNVQLSELLTIFNEIDWNTNENKEALKTALEDDTHYKKGTLQVYSSSTEQIVAIVREGIKDLILRIETQTILGGRPKDYPSLIKYSKWVIAILQKKNPDGSFVVDMNTRAQILLALGFDSLFCGPGIFSSVQTFVNRLYNLGLDDCESLVYFLLSLNRQEKFKKRVKSIDDKSIFSIGTNINHVHDENFYYKTIGYPYHFRNLSAENDDIDLSVIIKLPTFLKQKSYIKKDLSDADELIHLIQTNIGSSQLPVEAFNKWIQEWCKKNASKENIDNLWNEKSPDYLYEEKLVLDIKSQTIVLKETKQDASRYYPLVKEKYIKTMMIEMGILMPPTS